MTNSSPPPKRNGLGFRRLWGAIAGSKDLPTSSEAPATVEFAAEEAAPTLVQQPPAEIPVSTVDVDRARRICADIAASPGIKQIDQADIPALQGIRSDYFGTIEQTLFELKQGPKAYTPSLVSVSDRIIIVHATNTDPAHFLDDFINAEGQECSHMFVGGYVVPVKGNAADNSTITQAYYSAFNHSTDPSYSHFRPSPLWIAAELANADQPFSQALLTLSQYEALRQEKLEAKRAEHLRQTAIDGIKRHDATGLPLPDYHGALLKDLPLNETTVTLNHISSLHSDQSVEVNGAKTPACTVVVDGHQEFVVLGSRINTQARINALRKHDPSCLVTFTLAQQDRSPHKAQEQQKAAAIRTAAEAMSDEMAIRRGHRSEYREYRYHGTP